METDAARAFSIGAPSEQVDEEPEVVGDGAGALEDPAPSGIFPLVPMSPDNSRWESRDDGAAGSQPLQGHTWQQELPRWLATLDSARTRREYEKAVTYFFATPGVPDTLEALTLDLLLAYRGSLALRSERQPARRPTSRPAPVPWSQARLSETDSSQLPPGATTDRRQNMGERDASMAGEEARDGSATPGPLAPATVNLRLTALRQFLTHCTLWDLVPLLSPERTRAALRRLAVERRRPYQILAEPEWGDFLEAARAPMERVRRVAAPEALHPGDTPSPTAAGAAAGEPEVGVDHSDGAHTTPGNARGPWGTPRAVKARARGHFPMSAGRATSVPHAAGPTGTPASEPPTPHAQTAPRTAAPAARSTAGLTGARTAQRDHALLALALATGLRAVELSLLDLGDLAREWHAGREEWWLILPDAKTKGQHGGRTLPLAPELVRTLLDYARSTGREWERAGDRETPLFLPLGCGPGHVSRRDGTTRVPRRLSLAQIRCIVDRAETQWLAAHGDAARGSRAISPHALRHSTAIALLEGNTRTSRPPASVEHVRGWLGHVDIRTTQGYLAHLDDRRHHRPFTLEPFAANSSTEREEDSEN